MTKNKDFTVPKERIKKGLSGSVINLLHHFKEEKEPSLFLKKKPLPADLPQSLFKPSSDKKGRSSTIVLGEVRQLFENNNSITLSLATEFFKATKGAGDSIGKKTANAFMDELLKVVEKDPRKIERLGELTSQVMKAHCDCEMVGPTLPFLRATGFITDRLYNEYAKLSEYNFESTGMNQLLKHILEGKGFKLEEGGSPNNHEAKKNALVEIKFKLSLTDGAALKKT